MTKKPKPPTRKLTTAQYTKVHAEAHHKLCRLFGKNNVNPEDAISITLLVAVTVFKYDCKCTTREATEGIGELLKLIAAKMEAREGGFAE